MCGNGWHMARGGYSLLLSTETKYSKKGWNFCSERGEIPPCAICIVAHRLSSQSFAQSLNALANSFSNELLFVRFSSQFAIQLKSITNFSS